MPFVPQENRKSMKEGKPPETVGDMCYLEYVPIMEAWHKERRWTTAHNELKRVFDLDDHTAAKFLAYMVFFCKHVMPYEDEKEKDNGPI